MILFPSYRRTGQAVTSGAVSRAPARSWIVTAWLAPVAVQALAWALLFQPFPGDGAAVYARNIAASITGMPLLVGSFVGVVPPNDLSAYSFLAVATWTSLLLLAVTVARPLPLAAHLALSAFWNLSGTFLYLALCY